MRVGRANLWLFPYSGNSRSHLGIQHATRTVGLTGNCFSEKLVTVADGYKQVKEDAKKGWRGLKQEIKKTVVRTEQKIGQRKKFGRKVRRDVKKKRKINAGTNWRNKN